MKTIFGVKKGFFLCQYFSFWISESKTVFKVFFGRLFISLHHSQSQEMPSNNKGRFFSGWKYISLWSSKEKRTVMALARRRETLSPRTAPAGWRTAFWQGQGCPPAHPLASSSSGISVFIWCIIFIYESSVCGLVWLAAAGADLPAQKVHDLSI